MHDPAVGHWLERLAARTPPALVVANSAYTAGTLPRLFPGVPQAIIPCAVPPSAVADPAAARAAARRELGAADGAVVVLMACRLERWKGHPELIAALGRLRDRPGWMAWIAGGPQRPGESEYLARLRADAEAAGVADRVRFLGQRGDVPRLLAAADIHSQPNAGPEPFGIAFVEAMHAGLPVVATAHGGAIEVVGPDCGVLVPPGDVGALAEALGRLIADPRAARAARRRRPGAGAGPVRPVGGPRPARPGPGRRLRRRRGGAIHLRVDGS